MCVFKNKKFFVSLFILVFFSVFSLFAKDNLKDDLGVLSKSAFKSINKLLNNTIKKTGIDNTVVIIQDEADIAEDNLAHDMLVNIADDDDDYDGIILLIVLDKKKEVSALYMAAKGKKSEAVITKKRMNYIMDVAFDLGIEDEQYEAGLGVYAKMVKLFFEHTEA